MMRNLSPHFSLIHRMPCSCGSIISAQRAAEVMMAPFWIDSGSVGRPSIPHCALRASVERTSRGTTPAVIGISRSIMSGNHFSCTRASRNLELNGPAYDTKEDDTRTSPTNFASAMAKDSMAAPHRLFSPDRPLTRRSASSAFFCVLAAVATALFLSSVAFIRFSSRFATRACSSATLERMPDSFLLALLSLVLASPSSARLGATTW
mmetsp:Transcript_21858/g.35402  ORF Transcript_21858/g.35402 Transcript_21858/m.35402 type:complete len:207 (+) Transcript_21858:3953-4573(+)